MKNKGIVKKICSTVCILSISFIGYLSFEPAITDAATDQVTVTQNVTSELTISSPADVTMSASILGMSGGSATGSATWTVKTNDTSGFNMKIKASTSPALVSGANNFADYTEASAGTPDYSWGIAATDSEFGYTVEPATVVDTTQAFKDNGSVCGGSGTLNATDKCWDGFSTSDATIINRSSQTSSSGEAEVVKFQAQSGASHFQIEGAYTATITVTAVTN